MNHIRFVAVMLAITLINTSAWSAGTLSICAQHYVGDGTAFEAEFDHGPITVPAGTMLDYAGHAFNGASDPKDFSHLANNSKNWIGITAAEQARREAVWQEDASVASLENQHRSAVITIDPVVLTKHRLCATVTGKAFVSAAWHNDATTIFADPGIYFQVYGVIRHNHLETDFNNDSNPFEAAVARGQINAIVTKTIDIEFAFHGDDGP